jgi:hypothetical protein
MLFDIFLFTVFESKEGKNEREKKGKIMEVREKVENE